MGQIIQVVGDEVEVSCMQQLARKNVLTWPYPPDILFYYESDVLHIISDPEPVNSRHSKLTEDAWKQFQAHSLKGSCFFFLQTQLFWSGILKYPIIPC